MKLILLFAFALFPFMTRSQTNLLENPETHFHLWKTDSFSKWQFENGILFTTGGNADLVTNQMYGDFSFEFEYKLDKGGNSGVIYKVIEDPQDEALFKTHASGPEYQILDDIGYPGKVEDYQKCGSNYGLNAPSVKNLSKPAGEWNSGKIEVRGDQVKHWLNGELIVEYTYGDEAWKKAVAETKFAEWPYAAPHHEGHIALQDHGGPVWFRKLVVTEL